jgi:hypothetical protein
MSEEEDLVGTDIDRAIRAAMMGAGQVSEAVKRAGQERDRGLAERAQAAVRDQAHVTRSVHNQVGREAFWATANGERIANAATYGATLSNVDPGARDVYEIVREQAHHRYGIDVDSLRAQFPDSEDKRRDALMHAIDDYLAANREDTAAQADRTTAASLEQDAERGEAASESVREEEAPARGKAEEAAHSDARAVSMDAADHEDERDRLHADGAAEESVANTHEKEQSRSAVGGSSASTVSADGSASPAQRTAAPTSAAGRAAAIASTSYPKSANQTLTESRKVAAPRARVNRGTGPQKERGKDLGR